MNGKHELSNFEIPIERCTLDVDTNNQAFYRGDKKVPGFTGLYFRDDCTFFAIYPSVDGPTVFFGGKEYAINVALTITLSKDGQSRTFRIDDYGIVISYMTSPYIGVDIWSDEIDVDLFFMIAQRYKDQGFYDRYTLGRNPEPT